MTACTNNGGSRARRAITAALVGVLSVGTVPMAALAEGVGDAISPLFAEGGIDGTEFSSGTIATTYTKADGTTVSESPDIDGNMTVGAEDLPLVVTAQTVTPAGTNKTIAVTPGNDFKVALYHADENGDPTGSPLSGNRVTEAGDYVLTVTPLTGAEYVGQTFTKFFKVEPVQITIASVFEDGDTSDTTLTFKGSALDLGFTNNSGEQLIEGVDYSVKYSKDGKTVSEVVDHGTYTATLTGLGKYAGTSATKQFTVDAFELYVTDCDVVIDAFQGDAPSNPSRVYNRLTDTDLDTSLVGLVPTTDIEGPGSYSFKLSVDEDAVNSGNVLLGTRIANESMTYSAIKVDAFAQLNYKGEALQDSYDIFLDKNETFDVTQVTASYNGVSLGNASVIANEYVGHEYTPGTYDITLGYSGAPVAGTSTSIDGNYVAATKTVTVHVWKGAINADEELFVYGPDYVNEWGTVSQPVAITSYAKAYDGEALDSGDFFVVNADRSVSNLTSGSLPNPAELVATLYDSEGNKVTEITDAGEYTLEVTSKNYKLSGTTTLPITIAKVDLDSAEIGEIVKWNSVAGEDYLPLNGGYACGSNITAIGQLGLVFDTGNEGAAYDEDGYDPDDFKGEDLLPGRVDVTVEFNDNGTWKPVANIDKAGQYRVILTVGDDIAANFEGTEKTIEFTVAQQGLFKDVQPSAWYYDVVQKAYTEGYMNGTTAPSWSWVQGFEPGVFNPEGTLTRGQVAAVLFNASGEDLDETDSNYSQTSGWVTGFSDIDGAGKGGEFYAEGVAWCKQNGVVNGYGDGTFRPDQPVTREEFASMLANYAKVVLGDDTVGTVDAGVLADYPDGSKVTDWAEANVAWAAEKGIIGNGGTLMPTDTMTRAYCAAMMVNYLNPELAK